MNSLLKIVIIICIIIVAAPTIFTLLLVIFTYLGAIVGSFFGTDNKTTFLIIGILFLVGIIRLLLTPTKKNNQIS